MHVFSLSVIEVNWNVIYLTKTQNYINQFKRRNGKCQNILENSDKERVVPTFTPKSFWGIAPNKVCAGVLVYSRKSHKLIPYLYWYVFPFIALMSSWNEPIYSTYKEK